MRCCAVQADDFRSALAADSVGFKAFAVCAVGDEDLLVGEHPDQLHEIRVYGQAAFIVRFCLGDSGEVQFRFEHYYVHMDPFIFRASNIY